MIPSSSDLPTSTRRNSAASNRSKDRLTPEQRSSVMRSVRLRNTKPERITRAILHRLGLRFTVAGPYNRTLPSRPDIVLPRWRSVVLVHGCFWHRHPGCRLTTTPSNRADFWQQKFDANIARDKLQRNSLRKLGWRVIIVWECETRIPLRLERKLARLFKDSTHPRCEPK